MDSRRKILIGGIFSVFLGSAKALGLFADKNPEVEREINKKYVRDFWLLKPHGVKSFSCAGSTLDRKNIHVRIVRDGSLDTTLKIANAHAPIGYMVEIGDSGFSVYTEVLPELKFPAGDLIKMIGQDLLSVIAQFPSQSMT